MKIFMPLLLWGVFCGAVVASAPDKANVVKPNVVVLLHNSGLFPQAMRDFEVKFGKDACDCLVTTEHTIPPERLAKAKILFMEHPTEELLDHLRDAALAAAGHGMKVTTDVPELVQRSWGLEMSASLHQRLMSYFQNGGEQNTLSLLMLLYKEAGGPKTLNIPPPDETLKQGVYHPDAPKLFNNLTEYLQWYRKAKPGQGALVTVNFYYTFLKNRDTAHIDVLLRTLEKQGLAAAGVVGWPHGALEKVFQTPPDDPLKGMLMFTLALSRPGDKVMLEKQNVHVINLMATEMSYKEWEASDRGISPVRMNSSIVNPESAGATDPILVATTESSPDGSQTHTAPIPERVEMAAQRAKRWVVLNQKPNFHKRLVILYYNNPPGKGNIGASYLNVAPSIRAVLERLQREGYFIGSNPLPESQDILDMLERVGRNVENWAPGELQKIAEQGNAVLISTKRYHEWFDKLPEKFRKSVNDRWGPPEKAELMTMKATNGMRYFVIPGVRYGNIFLGPQLLRSSFKEYTNVQHSATLPPHHAYIAAYLYYRHQFGADAVIHMGRHGTLEWLPGKGAGQAGWDSSEVILGDLPNAYYYIMDGDGEAVQARRRSAAVDISHLTPMLAPAGNQARFAVLSDAVEKWKSSHEATPLLAEQYAQTAMAEAARQGLTKQLLLENVPVDDALKKIDDFLQTAEDAPIPLGLPTLGVMPSDDRLRQGLQAVLDSAFADADRKLVQTQSAAWATAIMTGAKPIIPPDWSNELREKAGKVIDDGFTWLANVRISPERELAMLPHVLHGEFEPSGLVGDPLRTPAALPSGRNLHQGDPATWPTPAAWATGKRLGDQLLDRYKKAHGRYPERISMILWQGETGRTEGAMEAEALYLMGVEPQWNVRGAVDKLKLIPEAQLTHPRVNVVFTVSGLYRDGLAEKIIMLDRAARLAASAGDNAVSRMNREVTKTLLASGMSPEQAQEYAGARVFTTAPGNYGFGLEQFVEQSRDKDEPDTMAQLYLTKMNYVYTEKSWGANVPKLLGQHLQGNETILHSRSSNLYGMVDNDDVYQWMGGLRVASASVGAHPELFINNMRKVGQERTEDARTAIATELNTRNWNPKWIAEMQKEGYAGGREMMRSMEYLYGWQATAPETISPAVWQKMYDVYVADQYKLGVNKFLEKMNPAAKQQMVARLLEVDRQGTYKFSAQDRKDLLKEYVQLVTNNGVACSANVCGNQKLTAAVLKDIRQTKFNPSDIEAFRKQFQNARRPAPAVSRYPTLNHQTTQRRSPLPEMKIKIVTMNEFLHRSAGYVRKNAWILLVAWLASLVLGGMIAILQRRRANTRVQESLLSAPEEHADQYDLVEKV